MTDSRRTLPSVDRLLDLAEVRDLATKAPRALIVSAVREVLAEARSSGVAPDDWAEAVEGCLDGLLLPSLRPVINATGIVLHTNLGRAPLAQAAIERMTSVAMGYSTLEYDVAKGKRGRRTDHCGPLLAQLAGAEAALVVNNAAAALVLVLNALSAGKEILISRGELIEIGGAFRIPDILEKSGGILREVGTTNRTHLDDYRHALGEHTGAVLTVHRSNFEQRGFVTTPSPSDVAMVAHDHGVPFIYDLGSGLLADLTPWNLHGEPRVRDGVATGADAIVFSGDKLLGGPQAGCLVGSESVVTRCLANPFARAMRADKFTLAALEATLALYRDEEHARREIPVLAMLTASPEDLNRRALGLIERCPAPYRAHAVVGVSAVGGGAFPDTSLPTTLVSLDPGARGADELAAALRSGEPPVIARIADGRVVLDPRTILPHEEAQLLLALESALGS
jgi:L-seryl-tRNA(Ser) seleniumtransferase